MDMEIVKIVVAVVVTVVMFPYIKAKVDFFMDYRDKKNKKSK